MCVKNIEITNIKPKHEKLGNNLKLIFSIVEKFFIIESTV